MHPLTAVKFSTAFACAMLIFAFGSQLGMSFARCKRSHIHHPLNLTSLDFACIIKIMLYFWTVRACPTVTS